MRTTINPEEAARLLSANTSNRKINKANLMTLSKIIKEGKWAYNGQPIIIGESGRLLDGQHRLLACVNTSVAIDSELIINVPDRTFASIDSGKARTPADVISTLDIKNSHQLSAALKVVYLYLSSENKNIDLFRFSNAKDRCLDNSFVIDCIDYIDDCIGKDIARNWNLDVVGFLNSIYTRIGKLRLLRSGGFVAAYIITSLVDPIMADKFFTEVTEGLFNNKNSPSKRINEFGYTKINLPWSNGTAQSMYKFGIYIKAFNNWKEGKEVKRLTIKTSGTIPLINFSNTLYLNSNLYSKPL